MNSNEVSMIHHGEQLFQSGRIEESLSIFNSVLEKDAGNLFALNDKGVALSQLKRYHQAIDAFVSVLEKDNKNSTAAYNLISNFIVLERYQDAEKALREYGNCLDPKDIQSIEQRLLSIKKTNSGNYLSQNSMDRAPFDYEAIRDRITDIQGRDLFFIMGAPKSGTTWLQYLLDGHPEIACCGEGNFNVLIRDLRKMVNDYNLLINAANKNIGTTNYLLFSQDDLRYLLITSIALLIGNHPVGPGTKCIGLKNPTLIENMEIHASLFPEAKFIHIIREGRDVIVSAWFNNLRANAQETLRRWPDFKAFVTFGVERWVSEVIKAREFGLNSPERYFELRYEDLHRDPDLNIERLLLFLDIDSSKQRIGQCREAGSFERLSKGRKRGNENRSEFFRKGIIGDWKNHFDRDSLKIFMDQGGDLLDKLGYEV